MLTAGALIASLLAVVASPAAAAVRTADAEAQWRACLGPATVSSGFDDVSDDGVHAANISCLKYYGITIGKTADTFDPSGNVTRSEMALFLARAAAVAGIDLGDDMGSGFVDLNADDTERVSAINRLVAKGIMFGDTETSFDPPSTTHFAPTDQVTRWEMAMFLFAFLDYALDSVLVDNDPSYIDGDDGVGKIEVGDDDGDGNGTRVDDYFRDARRETPAHVDDRIGAIYELGVTTGVNGEVGERGVFKPNGLVTRAEMASFIMRALNHTNLRPAGVTAQYVTNADGTIDTQVSVRDADFKPVPDQRVEVFYTHFEKVAFDSDGECVERYVGAYEQTARDACEIDRGDQETDDYGNALYEEGRDVSNTLTIHCTGSPASGTHTLKIDTPSSTAKFVAWAWQGDLYDEVDSDTARSMVVAGNANPSVAPAPTHAVVTGGKAIPRGTILSGDDPATGDEAYHVKMGGVLEYTIQLSRANVDPATKAKQPYVSALPVPGENYGFRVTELRITQDRGTGAGTTSDENFPFDIESGPDPNVLAVRLPQIFTPNDKGQIKVQIRQPDPVRSGANRDDPDVQVQIQVEAVKGNDLTLVESTNGHDIESTGANGWDTGVVTVGTGEAARTTANSRAVRFSDNDPWAATLKVTPERQLRLLAETTRGFVQVEIDNQYGDPFAPPRSTVYRTELTGDAAYKVTVDPSSVGDDSDTTLDESAAVSVAIRQRGKGTHSYTYADNTTAGSTASIETVAVVARLLPLNAHSTVPNIGTDPAPTTAATTVDKTANVMVYWASTGTVQRQTTAQTVLVADTSQRLIAVGTDAPVAYEYGSEDRFVVEGEVVSFRQFEDILDSNLIEVNNDNRAELEWDDYRRHGLSRRPTTDATWRLDDLNNCTVS